MKYNQPFNETNPNAGYVNGDPGAGVEGSIPPAEMMEYPQREIVYAILQSGQTPSNGDLTQLWKAIQTAFGPAAYVHSGTDTSNVANRLVADVAPNIAAYAGGHLYLIEAANASVDGGTQANFDNRGLRSVTRADGTPIRQGDWGVGQSIILADDGDKLQLSGVTTANVPASETKSYVASDTYTVPAGVTRIRNIRVRGAGGGGGGSTGSQGAGSGGGGGGSADLPSYPVKPGDVLVITVGVPGQGGVNGNGTAGGTVSIAIQGQAAFIAASGGGGGFYGNGAPQTTNAGLGGVGMGAGLNVMGGRGSFGLGYSGAPGAGIGGAGAFGAGSPTPNLGIGSTEGNFPGGGANGGVGGSNGANGGGGLAAFDI